MKETHRAARARDELNAAIRRAKAEADITDEDIGEAIDMKRSNVQRALDHGGGRHVPAIIIAVGPEPIALAALECLARARGRRVVVDAPVAAGPREVLAAASSSLREAAAEAAAAAIASLDGGVTRAEADAVGAEIDQALAKLHELRAAVRAAVPAEPRRVLPVDAYVAAADREAGLMMVLLNSEHVVRALRLRAAARAREAAAQEPCGICRSASNPFPRADELLAVADELERDPTGFVRVTALKEVP